MADMNCTENTDINDYDQAKACAAGGSVVTVTAENADIDQWIAGSEAARADEAAFLKKV